MRIPPRQPKRNVKSLFAPRDVTETARQGQGIGDIEAMRQMARTVIPEAMRMAPVTSAPMAGYDALREAGRGNYGAAGLAALGAIPFGGMIDDAARNAPKVFGSAMEEVLKKMGQFGTDLSEEAAIARRQAGASYTPPRYQGMDEMRADIAEVQQRQAANTASVNQAYMEGRQAIDRAQNAYDEAKAYRRAVSRDPSTGYGELDKAWENERQLKAARDAAVLARRESMRQAGTRNPIP
jgi:hypothetical protein